jgi:hypothetical protein
VGHELVGVSVVADDVPPVEPTPPIELEPPLFVVPPVELEPPLFVVPPTA